MSERKRKSPYLLQTLDAWERGSLGQRLEDSRMLLKIHGYISESESWRIKCKLYKDWQVETKP